MKEFLSAYTDLFEATNVSNGYRLNKETVFFNQLSHFVGMHGRNYFQQKTRLLIVGRAVNGWGQLDVSSAKAFADEAAVKLMNDHFNWIVYDNGALRNDYLDNGAYYWLNDSPFWRTSKKIWMNISDNRDFEDSEHERWVDRTAWTNLYKIAPIDTGNPTTAMSKNQLSACRKLLKAEIDFFKPTHILFITGYEWWFENFKDLFDIEYSEVKTNVNTGENKNTYFAETSGITPNGIKVVVACRPEFRDETLYVADVSHAFDALI